MARTTERTSILLLEDDVIHQSVLAWGLEDSEGGGEFEVTRVATIAEADEQLAKDRPEILVLDCVLGENRLQVIDWAARLRREGRLAGIPILFVTAHFSEMVERARKVQNSAILAKPFTFDDVTQKMRDLLAAQQARN